MESEQHKNVTEYYLLNLIKHFEKFDFIFLGKIKGFCIARKYINYKINTIYNLKQSSKKTLKLLIIKTLKRSTL
jgi:hypothetical protein|tara:strand:- start:1758 stop:1979 length:222 start_codon:yes stop_codon:yes gene_type:complete